MSRLNKGSLTSLMIAQAIMAGLLLALSGAPASAGGSMLRAPGASSHLTFSGRATEQMQETQMSFNLQYLQLQNQMQNENRQFTMVSNILKTKRNTAKNVISNIR
jgi:hypothetical protein